MSLGQALFRNLSSAISGKVVALSLGVVTYAVLARHLGAAGLGEYRTVLTLLAFAGMAFDFGLYKVTLRQLSEPGADQETILSNAFALRALATAVAVVVLVALVYASHFDRPILAGVLIAGAGWIAYQLSELAIGIFQQKLVQHRAAIAEVSGAATTLATVFALSFTGAGPTAMLGATAIGWLVAMAVSWCYAARLVRFRPRVDWGLSRKMILAGLPIAGSGVLMMVHLRGDVLMLATLSGAHDVGIYDVSLKIYELLSTVPYIFGGLLLPLFVADRREGTGLRTRLQAAVSISLMLAAVLVGAVMVHAEAMVTLLGGQAFVDSGRIMRLLVLSFAFGAVSQVIRFAAVASDQQHTMLKADVVAVLAALAAFVILIPRFGPSGAAIGKLVGDALILGLSLLLLGRQVPASLWRPLPAAVGAGCLVVVLLSAAQRIGMHWIPACVVSALAAVATLYAVPYVRRELRILIQPAAARAE